MRLYTHKFMPDPNEKEKDEGEYYFTEYQLELEEQLLYECQGEEFDIPKD